MEYGQNNSDSRKANTSLEKISYQIKSETNTVTDGRRCQAMKKISFSSDRNKVNSLSQILREKKEIEEAQDLSGSRYSFYKSPKSLMSQGSETEEEAKMQKNKPLRTLNKNLILSIQDIEATERIEESKQHKLQFKKNIKFPLLKKSSSLNNLSHSYNHVPQAQVNSAGISPTEKNYQENLFFFLAQQQNQKQNNDHRNSFNVETPPRFEEDGVFKNKTKKNMGQSSESLVSQESFQANQKNFFQTFQRRPSKISSNTATPQIRSQISHNAEFGHFQLIEESQVAVQIGHGSHELYNSNQKLMKNSDSQNKYRSSQSKNLCESSSCDFRRTKDRNALQVKGINQVMRITKAMTPKQQPNNSTLMNDNCQSQFSKQAADQEFSKLYQRQIFEVSNQEMKDQKNQLIRSKLFLNMVVHDMRNPTKSIKIGLQQAISKQRDLFRIFQEQNAFEQKCDKIKENLLQSKQYQLKSNDTYKQLFQENELGITGRVHLLIEQLVNNNKVNKQQNKELKECGQKVLELIDSALNEIVRAGDQQEGGAADELEYEDFDEEDMDEGVGLLEDQHQIVQQRQMNCVDQKLEQHLKVKKESNLHKDKKERMKKALGEFLNKFPNNRNMSSNEELVDDFINSYYFENQNLPIGNLQGQFQPKTESYDFSQQVNFDFKTQQKADKVDQAKQNIEQFREILQKMQDKIDSQRERMNNQQNLARHQLQILTLQNDQLQKHQEVLNRQIGVQNQYYEEVFKQIYTKTKDIEKILQSQMFSQQMMENLISDLLDLAKMQNNSFKFTNEYFSLSNTIYEAFQMLLFNANEKGIELKAEIDSIKNLNLIEAIHGDENRFLQILLNFLSNSLKFTDPSGSITVKIEILNKQPIINEREIKQESQKSLNKLIKQSKNKLSTKSIISIFSGTKNIGQDSELNGIDQVQIEQELQNIIQKRTKKVLESNQIGDEMWVNIQISIIDTGIGISQEGLKNLFIDFGKLDESSSRNRQGTGLGLSICKQIIESMGGSVKVTSEIGHGTQFIINMKAKCKQSNVNFGKELQDLRSYECSERNRTRFFKFIQKNKHEDILRSAIEAQIKSNKEQKARKNEQEIKMISRFEKFSYTKLKVQSVQQRCIDNLDILINETQEMTNKAERVKNLTQKSHDENDQQSESLLDSKNMIERSIMELYSDEQIIQANFAAIHSNEQGLQVELQHVVGGDQDQEVELMLEQPREPALIQQERSALIEESEEISLQQIQQQKAQDGLNFMSFNIGDDQQQENQIGEQPSPELESPDFRRNQNGTTFNSVNSFFQPKIPDSNIQFEQIEGQRSAELGNKINKNSELQLKKNSPDSLDINEKSSSSFYVKESHDIKFKCLIANDDPMQLYVLQIIFQMNNFEVSIAQNGHEAYEKVIESLQNKDKNLSENEIYTENLFDLIVLDLNMPISNGYEACKNIVNLYADNKQIFKIQKNEKKGSQTNLLDNNNLFGNNNQIENDSLHLQNTDLKPIIVACTSDIIDDQLLKKLFSIGFDNCYEVPIKDEQIKNELKPMLVKRGQQLNRKNEIMRYIVQDSADGFSDRNSYHSMVSSVQRQVSVQLLMSLKKKSNKFLRFPSVQKRWQREEEDLCSKKSEAINKTPSFLGDIKEAKDRQRNKKNLKKKISEESKQIKSPIQIDLGSFKQISEESKQSSRGIIDSPEHKFDSDIKKFPYKRQEGMNNCHNLCQDSLLKEMEALKSVSSQISSQDPNRVINKHSSYKKSKKTHLVELKDVQNMVNSKMPVKSPQSCKIDDKRWFSDQLFNNIQIGSQGNERANNKCPLKAQNQSMQSIQSINPNLPKLEIKIKQHNDLMSSGSSFNIGSHKDPKVNNLPQIKEESRQMNSNPDHINRPNQSFSSQSSQNYYK